MIYLIAIHCIVKEGFNTFLRNLVWIKPFCTKNCRNVVKYFSLVNITKELLPALVLKLFQPQVQENKLWQLCFWKAFFPKIYYFTEIGINNFPSSSISFILVFCRRHWWLIRQPRDGGDHTYSFLPFPSARTFISSFEVSEMIRFYFQSQCVYLPESYLIRYILLWK